MFAHELQRPHGPRTAQLILQSVFASEAIEAEGCRVLRGRKHGKYAFPVAVGVIAPSSAEDALAVFPQHLEAIIAASAEPKGCDHLSDAAVRSAAYRLRTCSNSGQNRSQR